MNILNNSPELGDILRDELPSTVEVLDLGDNLGYTGAANTGLAHWLANSSGDYAIVGSHDLHVNEDCIELLMNHAERLQSHGILGPVLSSKTGGASSYVTDSTPEDPVIDVSWLSGTCLLLRRECIQEIGGFDTVYSSYYEDVDICWRAEAAGWKNGLCTDATATDLGSGSPGALSRARMNGVRLMLTHRGRAAAVTELCRLLTALFRSFVGSFRFWRRDRERIRASRKRLKDLLLALWGLPVIWRPPQTDLSTRKNIRRPIDGVT